MRGYIARWEAVARIKKLRVKGTALRNGFLKVFEIKSVISVVFDFLTCPVYCYGWESSQRILVS
jgi:hypothetical protein